MAIFQQDIIGKHNGPRLLITAGVHGDEYEPIAAVRRLGAEIDPATLAGTVKLIPIANVPAFLAKSRTGPDQLDLARVFPGRPDGSPTEQIAHEITDLIRKSDYLIDLHTGGLVARISPLSGYILHEDAGVLESQRLMARAFNLPIVWGTNNKVNGRTLSVARDADVPAIYAEWGGGGGCEVQGTSDYVAGCLNVMHALGMLPRTPEKSRVDYVVEDERDESGVLQKHYLCDRPGYFETVCSLDDQVHPGDILGWIHSLHGEPSTPVASTQQGLVILLRSIPAVNVGDFLAVILESRGPGEYRYG